MLADAVSVPASRNARALKIDIVVPGRFHAFALARSLTALGHDVLVHTNYPRCVVRRFGVPGTSVRSFVRHGILSRVVNKSNSYAFKDTLNAMLHRSFGQWATRSVRTDADVIYGFSGVMEELLKRPRTRRGQLRALVRGSAHIQEQDRLLRQEEARVGTRLDRPTEWMIAREEREYKLADKIFVLSTFAHESFLARGTPLTRLERIALGVDVSRFRASSEVLDERVDRLLAKAPLRVLTVGTFSYRKGARDISDVAAALSPRVCFRFVGDRSVETADLAREHAGSIQFTGRVPEKILAQHYAWADLFFFPTIEDGYAAVLLQAAAAGLPIIATTNCSAPDFVVEGQTGWIHPIRDTQGFIGRLSWCAENREAVANMVWATARAKDARDWGSMATEFVSISRHYATQCQDQLT